MPLEPGEERRKIPARVRRLANVFLPLAVGHDDSMVFMHCEGVATAADLRHRHSARRCNHPDASCAPSAVVAGADAGPARAGRDGAGVDCFRTATIVNGKFDSGENFNILK